MYGPDAGTWLGKNCPCAVDAPCSDSRNQACGVRVVDSSAFGRAIKVVGALLVGFVTFAGDSSWRASFLAYGNAVQLWPIFTMTILARDGYRSVSLATILARQVSTMRRFNLIWTCMVTDC